MLANADETNLCVETEISALKRRSVHGAAVSFVGQAIRAVIQFGSQLYIAHLISPQAFGLIAMVAPILRFVQLFNSMGLNEAVIQRPSISQRELSGLFWINLAGSSLLALAFAATAPLAAWFYGEPRLPAVMVSLCVILLLAGLAAQPMAVLNRNMRFLPLTLIDVLSTGSGAVVGIGMATFGFGYWALVGLQVANMATLCILSWLFSGWRPSWPRWEPAIKSLLGFGGHITAFNILSLFAESSDKVLLGAAAGSLMLGLYDRSSMLVMTALVLTMATFTRIMIPLLSRLVQTAERYRRTYLRILQSVLFLLTPGLLCVIFLPECVVQTLLGAAWMGAVPIVRSLAIGAVVHPIIGSASWLFVSQGRANQQLAWGSVGFAAIVSSFLAGLPWGPVGIASAWAACSWFVQAPLILWASTRSGPVRSRDVVKACVPLAAATVVASAVLWFIRSWFVDSGLQNASFRELAFTLLMSYAVYGLVLALLPGGQLFLRDTWELRFVMRQN